MKLKLKIMSLKGTENKVYELFHVEIVYVNSNATSGVTSTPTQSSDFRGNWNAA